MALAWQAERDATCGGCGRPLHESTDQANQFAYEVEMIRCHACAAQQRSSDTFHKDGGTAEGLKVRFTKTPGSSGRR